MCAVSITNITALLMHAKRVICLQKRIETHNVLSANLVSIFGDDSVVVVVADVAEIGLLSTSATCCCCYYLVVIYLIVFYRIPHYQNITCYIIIYCT